jgi:hypothetical protein
MNIVLDGNYLNINATLSKMQYAATMMPNTSMCS